MEIDDNNSNNININQISQNDEKKENDKIISLGNEVTFTYIPYEQFNKLWIMGDFTDWEPKEMIRTKDVFIYKTFLLKGYKYYFCYNSRDNFHVDFNIEYELNPKNNQSNNFYIIPKDDSTEEIELFQYKEKGKNLFK